MTQMEMARDVMQLTGQPVCASRLANLVNASCGDAWTGFTAWNVLNNNPSALTTNGWGDWVLAQPSMRSPRPQI